MAPHDRIVVLLQILGAKREVALARSDVTADAGDLADVRLRSGLSNGKA